MLSRLQKTNKLHTMRMIFVIAIATATCDCNEDSYALLVSFDNWPEDVTKYLEQEQIDDKYKKESESWYDIPYSSIISRGQSAKIKFEARDGLGCTAADHEATIEIPFWPRQWVRVKVPWNKLAYPQCPPEWPSQMLTWDNPKLGNGLSPALGGTGDDDIWMVDSTGAAWHFDGQTWKNTIPNAAYGLTGIWSASRTNVWATSISGAIFHWNGESWTARQSFDKSIRQIFGVNSGNIYAVGVRGFMAHWDGISWTEIRPETTNDLNAIWGRSDAEVWAGGAKGTILHYDGKSWKKKEIPLPEPKMGIITKDIYSIWGPPATKQNPQPAEVWLVGDMGTRIRWNGSEFEHWRKGDISMPQLRVVRGFATQDNFADPSYVWISGSANRIEQSDFAGGKWKDFPIDAYPSAGVTSIFATSSANAWAAGDNGRLFHWNKEAWNPVNTGHKDPLNAVWIDKNHGIWVGGGEGCSTGSYREREKENAPLPAAILYRENSGWTQKLPSSIAMGRECVTGGWASSDGEMWAVGWWHPHPSVGRVARIYHYKDASTGWTREEIPQPYYPCEHEQLSSIWASKDIVVAVGNCGIISKSSSDKEWNRTPPGSYYGVWGSTKNDIWVVGGDRSNPSERSNPIIRRRIKDYWERVFPPEGVSGTLYGIWGTGANNIWAVGERGMVIYWNGTKWEIERSGTTQTIHAVWADRPNSAWAVGDEGTILFRDRWQWNPIQNTIGRNLHSVTGNESTIWIGGDMGTTLSIQRCTDVSCRPR